MPIKEYQNRYFQFLAFEKNLRRFVQAKVGKSDLSVAQVMILVYLDSRGDCGQKELTITFNASSAAMVVSVARLEEKGFISKTVNEEDKRNNIVALTEAGRAFTEEILSAYENCEKSEELLITEEELSLLSKVQKKLFSQMEAISPETV